MMRIDPDEEIYPIGVVSRLTGLPQRYLRALDQRGVLRPRRSEKNRRLYSENELRKLQDIYYLAVLRKVNIAGIKEILQILKVLCPEDRDKVGALFKLEMSDAEALLGPPVEVPPTSFAGDAEISGEAVPSPHISLLESPESTVVSSQEDEMQQGEGEIREDIR